MRFENQIYKFEQPYAYLPSKIAEEDLQFNFPEPYSMSEPKRADAAKYIHRLWLLTGARSFLLNELKLRSETLSRSPHFYGCGAKQNTSAAEFCFGDHENIKAPPCT